MPPPAVKSSTSLPRFSSSRRKSPSLITPTRFLALNHCRHAQLLARHFINHIRHLRLRVTHGTASPVCISDSTRASRFPNFPPGCRLAKSSSLNPRFSESVTASASPNASMVVVEAVGASPANKPPAQPNNPKPHPPPPRASKPRSLRLERPRDRSRLAADLIARHRNQRHLQPLDRRQQLQNLLRLPASRKRQHHVAAHNHPQIPVQRFHRMQIQRRRSRRTQRRRNLPRNQPALSHARDHHAPRHETSNPARARNAAAIGPAIRSASARNASASMRTTFSPTFLTFFMDSKC